MFFVVFHHLYKSRVLNYWEHDLNDEVSITSFFFSLESLQRLDEIFDCRFIIDFFNDARYMVLKQTKKFIVDSSHPKY